MSWGQRGKDIVRAIAPGASNDALKALADKTIDAIYQAHPTDREARANALKAISREILKKYPRRETETADYYFDSSGKGDFPRWRHGIFQYLTLGKNADRDRQNVSQPRTNSPPSKVAPSTTELTTATAATFTLETMKLEHLELNANLTETVREALKINGISLLEFVQKAVSEKAKAVVERSRKFELDLTTISTDELLTAPQYLKYPGRPEELARRAIKGIMIYNSTIAPERSQRWLITTSLITELTGARAAAVKPIMKQFETIINDHHATYELLDKYGNIDKYWNRKPEGDKFRIREIINLSELVPDGLE